MEDLEIWIPIINYENYYSVSNRGRVISYWNRKKPRILKQSINKGYLLVGLHKPNTSTKTFFIHKLVAQHFLNHTPSYYQEVVDHIDNNSLNNDVKNLQLISNRENSSKDKQGGTSKYVGVYWHKFGKKWNATARLNGKKHHLGAFTKEIDAHYAYQNFLKKLN
jgi:hypothetical protein